MTVLSLSHYLTRDSAIYVLFNHVSSTKHSALVIQHQRKMWFRLDNLIPWTIALHFGKISKIFAIGFIRILHLTATILTFNLLFLRYRCALARRIIVVQHTKLTVKVVCKLFQACICLSDALCFNLCKAINFSCQWCILLFNICN